MVASLKHLISTYHETAVMPGGWSFNMPKTLRTILHYSNSRFTAGDYDDRGRLKLFMNIIEPAIETASKLVDIDIKDIQLHHYDSSDEFKVWVAQRRLRQWMADNGFALFLNELASDFPLFGTVVFRLKNGKPEVVPVYNLRMYPTARTLSESPAVAQVYVALTHDLAENPAYYKEAVEELIRRGAPQYLVYEYYERTSGGWRKYVVADPFSSFTKDGGYRHNITEPVSPHSEDTAVILYEGEVQRLPYYEARWRRVHGRWLGRGLAELLEHDQIAVNEISYFERRAVERRGIRKYQTTDQEIGGQNLENLRPESIITVQDYIRPINEDNSDLSAFQLAMAHWKEVATQKSFATDILVGENLPSRTPFGVAALQVRLAASYFEQRREALGIALREFIVNEVIPHFQHDTAEETTLTFTSTDPDIEMFDAAVVQMHVDSYVAKYAQRTGFFPSSQEIAEYRTKAMNRLKRRGTRYLRIPKDYYKNIKYSVQVVITGENKETARLNSIYQFLLNLVNTNPSLFPDAQRVTRALLREVLTNNGVPAHVMQDLFTEPTQQEKAADELVLEELAKNPRSVVRGGTLPPLEPQAQQQLQPPGAIL